MIRAALLALAALGGCQSQEDEFTRGRLEDLCDSAVPVCQFRAGCVLDDDEFLSGELPGAWRIIVSSEEADQTLVVRILLREMVYPGTELLLRVFAPGCGQAETAHLVDVDLFHRAGDDRILQFSLPLGEPGDHLVELFSDLSATYLLTTSVEGP